MSKARILLRAGAAALLALVSVQSSHAADSYFYRYKGTVSGSASGGGVDEEVPITLGSHTFADLMVNQDLAPFDFRTITTLNGITFGQIAWGQGTKPLPAGLQLDPATGILSGRPTAKGDHEFEIVASGLDKEGRATYTIKVGDAIFQASAISGGRFHVCALTPSGGVKCWGYNNARQLGNGSTANSNVPVDVQGLESGVTRIMAGYTHTCAIKNGGAVCWGDNQFGKLGVGDEAVRNAPVSVPGLESGVTQIEAGNYHTCAIHNGAVKCWGLNERGQLGTGDTQNRSSPHAITALASGVTQVAAGGSHTCVIQNGGVRCVGHSYYGQLGNGSKTGWSAANPNYVQVSTLVSGVAFIDAQESHTCAITTGGAAQCWGSNEYGEIGSGSSGGPNSNDYRGTPTQVLGLTSGVTSISTGTYYTCAVHNGDAKCWGANSHGQLGRNTQSHSASPTPQPVTGLGGSVVELSAGGYQTCAILSVGKTQCWGQGTYGALGNGANGNWFTPVDVVPY